MVFLFGIVIYYFCIFKLFPLVWHCGFFFFYFFKLFFVIFNYLLILKIIFKIYFFLIYFQIKNNLILKITLQFCFNHPTFERHRMQGVVISPSGNYFYRSIKSQ
jgi:hypothetical protein